MITGSSTFLNNTSGSQGNDIYNGGTVTFVACDGTHETMADCCTMPKVPVCYTCDSTTGKCAEGPHSSLLPADCINSCKCVLPHNCGQLNHTVACNKDITGCSVCDACCKPWISVQSSCDLCFAAHCK
jgi:hypothetical protein